MKPSGGWKTMRRRLKQTMLEKMKMAESTSKHDAAFDEAEATFRKATADVAKVRASLQAYLAQLRGAVYCTGAVSRLHVDVAVKIFQSRDRVIISLGVTLVTSAQPHTVL